MFEPDGSIDVRLIYDHRVIDGAPIARALTELEEVLHKRIRAELLELQDPSPHASPGSAPELT